MGRLIDGLMRALSRGSGGWINATLPLMAASKSLPERSEPQGTDTHTHTYDKNITTVRSGFEKICTACKHFSSRVAELNCSITTFASCKCISPDLLQQLLDRERVSPHRGRSLRQHHLIPPSYVKQHVRTFAASHTNFPVMRFPPPICAWIIFLHEMSNKPAPKRATFIVELSELLPQPSFNASLCLLDYRLHCSCLEPNFPETAGRDSPALQIQSLHVNMLR